MRFILSVLDCYGLPAIVTVVVLGVAAGLTRRLGPILFFHCLLSLAVIQHDVSWVSSESTAYNERMNKYVSETASQLTANVPPPETTLGEYLQNIGLIAPLGELHDIARRRGELELTEPMVEERLWRLVSGIREGNVAEYDGVVMVVTFIHAITINVMCLLAVALGIYARSSWSLTNKSSIPACDAPVQQETSE